MTGDQVLSEGNNALITNISTSEIRDDQVVFTGNFSDGSQEDTAGTWGGTPGRGHPRAG